MSWIERAKVGDKVVFTGFKGRGLLPRLYIEADPVVGEIYTIRHIRAHGDEVGLLLQEIVNEPHDYAEGFGEVVYCHTCFKPAKNTTHQVEALKRLCNPTPEAVA